MLMAIIAVASGKYLGKELANIYIRNDITDFVIHVVNQQNI
jgi:hypothetical protein